MARRSRSVAIVWYVHPVAASTRATSATVPMPRLSQVPSRRRRSTAGVDLGAPALALVSMSRVFGESLPGQCHRRVNRCHPTATSRLRTGRLRTGPSERGVHCANSERLRLHEGWPARPTRDWRG